jgi:NAD(P)-dependent dehydrogenase (short-subunit alcohol dehydrogenase family)
MLTDDEAGGAVRDVKGSVVVVTGSGGQHGIGRATAGRLAEEGARVPAPDPYL